ncbi:hypothetical protein A9Q81_20070 [Gammaproteobacteria bacterium 42_54_T18]|nr:hypothetical protein A9Q81_20070 [Gammaproteobacteria bacterium 42_54_T18]
MSTLSDNAEMKEKIKAALFQCMLEMSYSKITVKTLAARVGTSRQNFYRYYLSKDDVLLDLIDNTLDAAYQIIESNLEGIRDNVALVSTQIESLILPQKDLINELLSCSNEKVVFSHMRRFVRRVVGRLLREENHTDVDQDYLDIIISQYSGSGYHMVKTWAQNGSEIDSSKFRHLVFNFVDGGLKAVDDAGI